MRAGGILISSRGIASASTIFGASTLDDDFTFSSIWRTKSSCSESSAPRVDHRSADRTRVNRYHPGSLSHPSSAGRDWNRSFETEPAVIRGGALLLHGLTDSPYSMRTVAEVLQSSGVYSLTLRMPGHGTVPSGLVQAGWEDWLAAVVWAFDTCAAGFLRERRSFSWAIRTAVRWR